MAGRVVTIALLLAVAAQAVPMLAGDAAAAATTTRVEQRYVISALLDVGSGQLDAVETLTLTNRARHGIDHVNLSVIPRALGYLAMDEAVSVDGDPAETSWTTTTNLRVELHERLAPDETVEITVPFSLSVGTSGGAFPARLSRENGVISFGEWFPILSREHDSYGVGDPQVSFNAESIRLELDTTTALPRDAVACPGLVIAPATTGTRWECEAEDVRDFSFVVNPGFALTRRTVGDMELRVYTQTVSGAVTADLAETALIGLSDMYGAYPWPDLVIAEIGSSGGFSMEYPRAIHLTRSTVTDTYNVYHEVAHQWFYAQIGNDQQLEPWIDEGFADFSTRYLMGIGENQCSGRDVDSSVFAWEAGLIDGGDWTSCDGYFHSVFYKGTEFLTAVSAAMGEEQFFAALREFIDRNRFGVVSTRKLLDHLDNRTPADLRPIYQGYMAEYDAPVATPRPKPRATGMGGIGPR